VGNRERLLAGRTVEEEKATDDFFGFSKWTVEDSGSAGPFCDPGGACVGAEGFARSKQASRCEVLAEAHHSFVSLPTDLGGRLGLLAEGWKTKSIYDITVTGRLSTGRQC
jgi:hypothetical protein